MDRRYILLLLLGAFASLVSAASAPTFCKCTCFTNSTIIEIKSHRDLPSAGGGGGEQSSSPAARAVLDRRAGPSLCSQCNRAFCLERYNLPICQGAGEKDVFTMCFQRDSRKDEIIVWTFILGTASLLGWAAVRRVMEAREKARGLGVLGASRSRGGGGLAGSVGISAGRGAYRPVGEEGRSSTGSTAG